MTKTIDLIALRKENVEPITAQLSGLSDVELATLQVLERADEKPRTSLIQAIDNVQADRAEERGRAWQAQLDEAAAKAGEAAQQKVSELEAELAATKKKLAAAEKKARATEKRTAKKRAVREVHLKLVEGGEPVEVVFADAQDRMIATLPALSFGEGQFGGDEREGSVLNEAIEFDGAEAGAEIASVWQIDAKGKGVGVSRLMVPMQVGAGRRAQLPARSLRFEAA